MTDTPSEEEFDKRLEESAQQIADGEVVSLGDFTQFAQNDEQIQANLEEGIENARQGKTIPMDFSEYLDED